MVLKAIAEKKAKMFEVSEKANEMIKALLDKKQDGSSIRILLIEAG